MGFCKTHAKEKVPQEQQQAKNAKCAFVQCKNLARTTLLGGARGMCFKHANDAECKMPKQKKEIVEIVKKHRNIQVKPGTAPKINYIRGCTGAS